MVSSTSTRWRGWNDTTRDGPVASDRLESSSVANRWFPKVRSWFALGAPLELLSPLSLIRVVTAVAAATWSAAIWVGAVAPVIGWALVVTTLALLGWSTVRTDLSERFTRGFVFALALAAAAAAASGDGTSGVIVYAVLGTTVAITTAMFCTPATLGAHQLTAWTAMVVAVGIAGGGREILLVATFALVAAIAAMTTAVTTRSARRGASVDADTGLPNSHGLEAALTELGTGGKILVCTVHLQGVAEARDALGHRVASELVRRAVENFGQVLPADAVIGRAADDEIVTLVPAADLVETRAATLRSIEAAVGSGRHLIGSIEVAMLAHVGTSVADPADPVDATETLRRSTLAARTAVKAAVLHREWDGTSTTLTADDLTLLADLRHAAERGELWLAYQPKITVSTGATASVEALLRWTSARHGNVSPARFIPLAERTGLIDRLTEWVLSDALDAQVRWRQAGHALNVSVNVSPRSLRSTELTSRVTEALWSRSLGPDVLTIEVTESLAFDIPEAVERLGPLKRLGVRISIDDFGTGYTSLAVLPHLPLDEIKLDQQFVRQLEESAANDAIVRAVVELAHRLGLTAVAEGVETARLADKLSEYGYDVLQGFHISRPLPQDELMAFIAGADDRDPEPGRPSPVVRSSMSDRQRPTDALR
jgi:EAL domain-containing protein (putative c-di-GMP-specific phosphodiesterase class I)/GGDEF domain-containing protein